MNFSNWMEVKDGHPAGRHLYNSHYSCYHYADGRQPKLFVGPGEKLVLITPDYSALFVWRKFKSLNNQKGINCSVFRNESSLLSSALILEAEQYALSRWPSAGRFYTYVSPTQIKSNNPGFCFKKAGWKKCGITKRRKLHILEKVFT